MTRQLPPKHRPGSSIQPGQDFRPVGEDWTRVIDRDDVGPLIRLTLDGGREFWVVPNLRYETRRHDREA